LSFAIESGLLELADPETSARVYMLNSGSICEVVDIVDGIEVTCIDNGMPVVLLRAKDLKRTAYESREDLNKDEELKAKLESIRLQAGLMMNLRDVSGKVALKIFLIAEPLEDWLIYARTFILYVCHAVIGVLGAVSVTTVCVIPETIADSLAVLPEKGNSYSVEHPSGEFSVNLEVDYSGPQPNVHKAGLLRTARLLSKDEVFISAGVRDG